MVGLTGGIASGKSTVSGMLRALGAQVIDADVVAREVVEPGTPGLAEIAARFPGVVGSDGRLDRERLGARVFGHDEERRALNALLHPRIQQAVVAHTEELGRQGHRLVIYDAPLIVENGLHHLLDGLIVVAVPVEVQLSRLMARNGLSREAAEARVRAQLPLEEKKKVATWVVDNSGPLDQTQAQVEQIWRELTSGPAMLPGR